jgi:hypothetical protein
MSNFRLIVDNFLSSGINVLPINPGKIPYSFKENKFLEWTKYQFEMVCNNGLFEKICGLAIVCGDISGNLIGIDIDTKNDPDGDLWDLFIDKFEEFFPNYKDEVVIEQSPSGGYHIYLRSEVKALKTEMAAKNEFGKAIVEIKANGGLLTCFPTPNYKMIQGKFSSLPVFSSGQTEILLSLCRSFNQYIELKDTKDYPRRDYSNTDKEKSPFHQFNENGNILPILENHGWKVLKTRFGVSYLRFPNSHSEIHHATFNKIPKYLYCFSPNSDFEDYKAYSQSAIYCKLECNDDWKLCAEKLLEQGFGERYEKKLLSPVHIPRVSNDDEPPKISKFPIEVFPNLLQEIVYETCSVLDFSPDFLSMAILNAVSGALGLTHKIRMKNGWEQYGSLFTALVGSSAIGKSPTMKWAFAPLIKQETFYQKDYQTLKDEYDYQKGFNKKEKSVLGIQELKEPKAKELIINDSTIESLIESHSNNPKGLVLYVDELTAWVRKFNSYRKGGDEKNWLSIFDNGYVKTNRISRGVSFMPKTYVTVCGGIQPKILKDLATGSLEHDGFLYRFNFVYTQEKEAMKWEELSKRELSKGIIADYYKIINHFISFHYTDDSEKILPMTDDADKLWGEWYNKNEALKKKYKEDEDEAMLSISGKLSIYCTRFALLCQMMNYVCGEDDCEYIQKTAVESAIKLTEYFRIANQTALTSIKQMKIEEADEKRNVSGNVNWNDIFGEERVLQRKILVERINAMTGKSIRTADTLLKKELTEVKTGYYRI